MWAPGKERTGKVNAPRHSKDSDSFLSVRPMATGHLRVAERLFAARLASSSLGSPSASRAPANRLGVPAGNGIRSVTGWHSQSSGCWKLWGMAAIFLVRELLDLIANKVQRSHTYL